MTKSKLDQVKVKDKVDQQESKLSQNSFISANCEITVLDPNFFRETRNIVRLELDQNSIRDLPVGVFNLPRLVHLGLTSNQLRVIDSLSFGESLNTLRSLHFDMNNVEAIDLEFFNNATDLFSLIAYQNECADFSAIDIQLNREAVLAEFAPCFNAFDNIGTSCEFDSFEGMYRCVLSIDNPQGKHRFDRIGGEHIGGLGDNSVTYVEAVFQNTKTIPSIICEQFRNVEGITFIGSQVEFVTEQTFAGCELLFSLNLANNNIRMIPPNIFR